MVLASASAMVLSTSRRVASVAMTSGRSTPISPSEGSTHGKVERAVLNLLKI